MSDDEDEELAKLDAGNLKGLSRKDFQSEEEYSAYKAQQEANPKGSFQFGVKGADGRMKGKERDKKQSAELQKVRKMLTEQHGDKYEVRRVDGHADTRTADRGACLSVETKRERESHPFRC